MTRTKKFDQLAIKKDSSFARNERAKKQSPSKSNYYSFGVNVIKHFWRKTRFQLTANQQK